MKIFNFLRNEKKKVKENISDTDYISKEKENILDQDYTLEEKISKLNEESRQKSEMYYKLHQSKIKKMNPDKIDLSNFTERELTSVEVNFLKYLDNVNVEDPYIAGYWTHEYNIDYAEVMKQFLGQGLIEISDKNNLKNLAVVELKNILSSKGISKSGRKAHLIHRVQKNFTPGELEPYLKDENRYYKLTPKGLKLTKHIKPSITKNISMEDKCYKLIMDGKINEAYIEIAKFEAQKPLPRGLGIDWNIAAIKGLNESTLDSYYQILNQELNLPENLLEHQKTLNACIILGKMFGVGSDKVILLFERIIGKKVDKGLLGRIINRSASTSRNTINLNIYKELGTEEYIFLATLDTKTCEKCGELDGKVFKITEAKLGINYPPICDNCRCIAAPHYEGNIKERWARDPETGKGYRVPGNMSYKEWYNNHF